MEESERTFLAATMIFYKHMLVSPSEMMGFEARELRDGNIVFQLKDR